MPVHRPSRRGSRATPVALFALGLFTAACTLTERQVAQQDGRIDLLQEQVIRLERSLAEGGGAAAPALDPQLARRLADLGQQVTQLADDLRTVQGRLDAVEQSTAAGASPLAAASLGQLEQEVKALALRLAEVQTAQRTAAAPASVAVAAPAAVPGIPSQRLTGQQLYDQGYTLYKQARYEDARQVLRQYAAEHPDTNLTDNALFWVGETYYDQAQYEQAILEYDKVVQRFPQGDKVSSALLKQAFAFDAIGDPADAKILLRKLLREHPTSEQAVVARKKLEILGD